MKNILIILVLLLLSSCNLVDYEKEAEPIPAVAYPNTPVADARFNGKFGLIDDLGYTRVTFNGTHNAHVYRFWTYTYPYSENYRRNLTFETDGTLTAKYYEGFGWPFYEFLYNHATYSWNGDGTVLTINGRNYTKE